MSHLLCSFESNESNRRLQIQLGIRKFGRMHQFDFLLRPNHRSKPLSSGDLESAADVDGFQRFARWRDQVTEMNFKDFLCLTLSQTAIFIPLSNVIRLHHPFITRFNPQLLIWKYSLVKILKSWKFSNFFFEILNPKLIMVWK